MTKREIFTTILAWLLVVFAVAYSIYGTNEIGKQLERGYAPCPIRSR